MPDDFSRRSFLKRSTAAAIAAAPAMAPAQAANDKIHLAWIGSGSRGYYLMERMYKGGGNAVAEVTAVCDTYTGNLQKGKDRVQTLGGNTPKTYEDYRDLLSDSGVDAVFIAAPEHLHYPMFMAAIKAGKNIYCEKPLAHASFFV